MAISNLTITRVLSWSTALSIAIVCVYNSIYICNVQLNTAHAVCGVLYNNYSTIIETDYSLHIHAATLSLLQPGLL